MDPELFLRTQAVNLNGLVWCCRAVAPAMVAQGGGTIVAFASGTAVTGKAGSAAYTSSKGGVLGFVKTLALELRDDNVRVNILRPGVVDTPQFRNSNPRGGPPIPLDSPEDVVGPLLFLLSEQATMTGSTVAREMPFPATKAAVR
jgi:2-hydroxycyclohexanecarboxyl-CoA dehydrogenase